METPAPILVIENKRNENFKIVTKDDQIIIYKDIVKLYEEYSKKYRIILFINCDNCNIIIASKLLKFSLVNAINCNVYVNANLIGPLEMYCCKNTKVIIKSTIPITYSELCNDTLIYQRPEELKYIILGTSRFTLNKTNDAGSVIKRHYIDSLFCDNRMYSFSKDLTEWQYYDQPKQFEIIIVTN